MSLANVQKYILLGLLLLLSGCAGRSPLQTRFSAGIDSNVCTLAVLPFENWTSKSENGLVASRLFSSELVVRDRFNVIAEGDVGLFHLRQRLLPGAMFHKAIYDDLAGQMNADAVVIGRIIAAGMDSRRGGDRVPFVSLQVDLYDLRSDQLLLSTVHRRWGDEYRKVMHFGLVTTVSGVLQKMSQEIVNDWLTKGVTCQ